MFKLADLSLDISSDPGYRMLSKIASDVQMVGLSGDSEKDKRLKKYLGVISKLEILDAEDVSMLPDGDFGLIFVDKDKKITRRFPCPDINNAIVSSLYLAKSCKEMPDKAAATAASVLHQKIEAAERGSLGLPKDLIWAVRSLLRDIIEDRGGDVWDEVQSNVYREPQDSELEEFRSGFDREAKNIKESRAKLCDQDFVFVTRKEGQVRRLFPVSNEQELRKQAEYFNKNYTQFSLEQRHTFAKKLRDKAAEYFVQLPGQIITKYASFDWSPTAEDCLKVRIDQLKQYDIRRNEKTAELELHSKFEGNKARALVGYVKLSACVGNMDIDKYASLLHQLDKASGLDKGYGKYIRDAYSSTYMPSRVIGNQQISKIASAVDAAVTDFMGNPVKAVDLMNLNAGDVGGMVDQETLDEMGNDPISVFNSLPIPYKSVIVEAIKSKGGK